MFKILQYYIFLVIILCLSTVAQAQKGERIKYKAEELEYGKKKDESYRKLTGDVVFTQKEYHGLLRYFLFLQEAKRDGGYRACENSG